MEQEKRFRYQSWVQVPHLISQGDVQGVQKWLQRDTRSLVLVNQLSRYPLCCLCPMIIDDAQAIAMLSYLVKKGLAPRQTKSGYCIVKLALKFDKLLILRYVMELANLPIRYVNESGETLLHSAMLYNSTKIAKYLMDMDIDLNAQDHGKLTPLHCAIMTNNLDKVRMLIQQGADMRVKDIQGQTALELAQKLKYFQIVDQLSEKNEGKLVKHFLVHNQGLASLQTLSKLKWFKSICKQLQDKDLGVKLADRNKAWQIKELQVLSLLLNNEYGQFFQAKLALLRKRLRTNSFNTRLQYLAELDLLMTYFEEVSGVNPHLLEALAQMKELAI